MNFSTMILSMYVDADGLCSDDERILNAAVDQSLFAAGLGFNPWFTEHHFRGPWHSAPLQFAAYLAPQLPVGIYLGFGVLSLPVYHPIRLVEQMNLLDQLTKGHVLYGLGSGFPGIEPASAGLTEEYHESGQAARDSIEVMERAWDFEPGDEPYEFRTGIYQGRVVKRIVPAPYQGRRRPTIIRTASTNEAVVAAAQRGWPAFLGTGRIGVDEQIQLYRRELSATDHLPEVIEECLRWSTVDWTSVVVAETDEIAGGLAEQAGAERRAFRDRFVANNRGFESIRGGLREIRNPDTSASFAAAKEVVTAESRFEAKPAICGSPETVAAEVQKMAALGVNHMLLRFMGEWHGETRSIAEQSMRLFAEHVMPLFVHETLVTELW
jgi:alkanesulfonate monooxygenase SsuD/methylene tetrahydromethanopterin reductase-like flavin-dependent oxidoreductase (luciferase family)